MSFDVPPPPPTEWTKDDDKNPGETKQHPNGPGPTTPTSVHTPSLDAFANYMGELVAPLNLLLPELAAVDVQPGAFYHADVIRATINGLNGNDGLKSKFSNVISDLVDALGDIQTAITEMSTKYKSTEDLNKVSVTDLQKDFQSVQGDFTTLMNDASGNSSGSSGS